MKKSNECTLIIIKPDAFKRGIMNEVFEFMVNGMNNMEHSLEDVEFTTLTKEVVEKHYEEHKDKHFYKDLVEFMTSGKVMVMSFVGENVVKTMRNRAMEARKVFQTFGMQNLVHASDSPASGLRETKNMFGK